MGRARKGRLASVLLSALMSAVPTFASFTTSAADFPVVGNFAEVEQAQTRLAEKLLSLHSPGFRSVKFRAELAPDNSAISFACIYEDGHEEYED